MNDKIEAYFNRTRLWSEELKQLRTLVLACGLREEYKWRNPCYTFNGKNIAIIGEFKDYCVLSFFKGTLLGDPEGILESPGENSQATRQIRFTDVKKIVELSDFIKAYIHEALEVEKQGLKVSFKNASEYDIPDELQEQFDKNPEFKNAFESLTPGRQKGYLLHFSAGKQPATRLARIEKYTQRIFDGKGIHDCVCGMSKKYPRCDGSHKYLT